MKVEVTCAVCYRVEQWSDLGDPIVLVEGGARRVDGDPARQRLLTALDASEGRTGPVVAVCQACGQLMLAPEGSGLEPLSVREVWRGRTITVAGRVVSGEEGLLDPSEARRYVEEVPRRSMRVWVREDLAPLFFFIVLIPVLVYWLFTSMFMVSFIASLLQGAPPSISGTMPAP